MRGNITGWGWWAGPDQEIFRYGGPFATREEAIECGRENADPGEGFFIVEAAQHQIRLSARRLIEDQYFDNDDFFDCENAEPDRMADHKGADAELQALLDAWVEKHRATFISPNMFAASRNEAWIEPAEETNP